MFSGSTVSHPLIFETIVSVYFLAVASCLTLSKLFSMKINYNIGHTRSIEESEVVRHGILIIALLVCSSLFAVVKMTGIFANVVMRL